MCVLCFSPFLACIMCACGLAAWFAVSVVVGRASCCSLVPLRCPDALFCLFPGYSSLIRTHTFCGAVTPTCLQRPSFPLLSSDYWNILSGNLSGTSCFREGHVWLDAPSGNQQLTLVEATLRHGFSPFFTEACLDLRYCECTKPQQRTTPTLFHHSTTCAANTTPPTQKPDNTNH